MDRTKVLVTGSEGFIGKNLVARLIADGNFEVFSFDIGTDERLLDEYCKSCAFVFHLAGVNRPKNPSEFMEGNFSFTVKLLNALKKASNRAPILLSGSVQAALDNDYGKSKKACEDSLRSYGAENGVQVHIFRLPNVFGKWCRPNYNSAVATFCHNIANGLPIQINDRNTELRLVYIDDVIDAFLDAFRGKAPQTDGFSSLPVCYQVKLGAIADLLNGFAESRKNLFVADQTPESFEKKLYATYTSYLPKDKLSYGLKMNLDERGSFTEAFKSVAGGQVSVNITKPGIVKGNHWHHTKNEKFLVVSGNAVIRLRKIDESEAVQYFVSGDKLTVVDIPCGYTHNIENLGETDLITIMWVSEPFYPDRQDTVFLKV